MLARRLRRAGAALLLSVSCLHAEPSVPVTADLFVNLDQNGYESIRRLQFVQDHFRKSVLGVRFHYLVTYDEKTKSYSSRWGDPEMQEIKTQLLLSHFYPEVFPKYLACRPFSMTSDDCLKLLGFPKSRLAARQAELDPILAVEAKNTAMLSSSQGPVLLVGNQAYQGTWDALSLAAFINQQLPVARRIKGLADDISKTQNTVRIDVVVDDPTGASERDANFEQNFSRWFGVPPKVETIPYQSEKGRQLAQQYGIQFLPAYLIAGSDKEIPNHAGLARAKLIHQTAGRWIVSDGGRAGKFLNRTPEPKTLTVFVMSQCPFGVKAEQAILQARREGKLPKEVAVRIRFIANLNAEPEKLVGKFRSLHGMAEWEEDIRQLVIQKHFADRYWDYLAARNLAYTSSQWEKAARTAGLDPEKIQELYDREGEKLLSEEIAVTEALGVRASPTFLWQNTDLITDRRALSKIPEFSAMKDILNQEIQGAQCQ